MSDAYLFAPDAIVKELGPAQAILFGRVLRYCMEGRGQCFASLATLGKECNISPATAKRWGKQLCQAGYLSHDSGKARGQCGTFTSTGKFVPGRAAVGVGQKDLPLGQSELPSEPRGVGQNELQNDVDVKALDVKALEAFNCASQAGAPAPDPGGAYTARPDTSGQSSNGNGGDPPTRALARRPSPWSEFHDRVLADYGAAPTTNNHKLAGTIIATAQTHGLTPEQAGRGWTAWRGALQESDRQKFFPLHKAANGWGEFILEVKQRGSKRAAPAAPAGAPPNWYDLCFAIVPGMPPIKRAPSLILPKLGLEQYAPPELWPAWLREALA